jgi:hypothetical protein
MSIKSNPRAPVPHSWDLKSWESQAGHVWPHDESHARRVLRAHRAELYAAGALTRIGRNLVFLGPGYQRWLASNMRRVTELDVPMNRPENADKRFGGRRAGATS